MSKNKKQKQKGKLHILNVDVTNKEQQQTSKLHILNVDTEHPGSSCKSKVCLSSTETIPMISHGWQAKEAAAAEAATKREAKQGEPRFTCEVTLAGMDHPYSDSIA